MLNLHPESDLSQNVMVFGAQILSELRRRKNYALVEDLMRKTIDRNLGITPDMYLDALSFLYIFDFIKIDGYKINFNEQKSKQISLFT